MLDTRYNKIDIHVPIKHSFVYGYVFALAGTST
jgi:hypothetical protein